MPQHDEEDSQREPRPVQVPSVQAPEAQSRTPQHWPEEVQPPPRRMQIPSPEQMPPEQVLVPQQSAELVQTVPAR